jgi:FAD/FMN-containing dehydrogenase
VPRTPIASLERVFHGSVRTDAPSLARFRRDASHLEGSPRAVVAPAQVPDVVALVGWARRHRIPLVPRGGGTSLDGESVPADGSVVVDLSGWNSVLEVEPDERWARVGPGLVNRDLQEALRPFGMFFPPNPGSWTTSTIGGNVGTNASGPRSFRYGPTRAWVREVEAVLGTGERARFGSRVAKRSVGPDLLQILVGSEGTLAILTEVTVRLAPRPTLREGWAVPLPKGLSIGAVARRLARAPGTGLSAVEYLDQGAASALAETQPVDWPTGSALLLLELEADGPTEAAGRRRRVRSALRSVGVTGRPAVFPDADELWTIRGASGVVLEERMGRHVREDVAVPLGRIDALVHTLERIGRTAHVPLYLYGHLGEGSLHPNYVVDPTTPAAEEVRTAVLTASLDLGGTVSAEHGIGRLKVPFLRREVGETAVDLLDAVKRRCDPDGILNPGKLYPGRARGAARLSRSPSGSEAGAARSR